MRTLMLALGAATLAIPATIALPAAKADAQSRHRYAHRHHRDYDTRTYRDDRDNRHYVRCRKKDGTTGLVVGGVAGALLGRTVDTRGDRTVGTLGGAAAGALAGRAIDRSGSEHCR